MDFLHQFHREAPLLHHTYPEPVHSILYMASTNLPNAEDKLTAFVQLPMHLPRSS